MSVAPPGMETPGSALPSSGPRDAKAEAKAAKAYAKALRPWYKRKRYVIPMGLMALVIATNAGSSGGGGATTTDSVSVGSPSTSTASDAKVGTQTSASTSAGSDSQTSASTSAGSASNVATVGQPVTNAGTTYQVTNVSTTDRIGDEFTGERADGTFVVVSLQLTNHKNETKTFMAANAKIQTSDGTQYETSDKAAFALGDDDLTLKDMQPDLPTTGKLAFELPPSKVSGSSLVIEDLWGSGEVKVNLGL